MTTAAERAADGAVLPLPHLGAEHGVEALGGEGEDRLVALEVPRRGARPHGHHDVRRLGPDLLPGGASAGLVETPIGRYGDVYGCGVV